MVEMTPEQIEKLKAVGRMQKDKLLQMGKDFEANNAKYEATIFTCNATSCHSGGGQSVYEAFKAALETAGLTDKVRWWPQDAWDCVPLVQ